MNKNIKSIKEIVGRNEELESKAASLLNENNREVFENNYYNVQKELLDYRNQKIDDYILNKCKSFSNLDMDVIISEGITLYVVNPNDLDNLGILIEKLFNKYIAE